MSKIKSCCNYDQRCPEWTVMKNNLVIVDDWNVCISQNLEAVDSWLRESVIKCKNAEGIILSRRYFLNGNEIYIEIKMTKEQLAKLIEYWEKWKKDNPLKIIRF